MLHNWYLRLPILLKTIKTISNYKYLFKAKMMQFTWVPYSWDLQQVSQLELSLILVLNIWQLPPYCVMTRPQEIINSRNTTHSQEVLLQEIKCIRDVKLWHMTCINLIQIKFYRRLHQNWHMDQLNSKDLFGRTIHAYSLLKERLQMQYNWNLSLNQTNALSSNSWLYTNHKVLVMTQMVFLDFLLIRTWKRKSSTIYGLLRTMELSTELWLVSV